MVQEVQRVKETVTRGGDTVQRTKEVSSPGVRDEHGTNVAERVIWFIAGVLMVLLAFRFILSFLGANRGNAFANFIYDASHPFVAPFFSLFSYNTQYGVSRFEVYTLVAMLVYAVIAWGLVALVNINRR